MDRFDLYAPFYDLDLGYDGSQETDADLFMIQEFAARCGSPILELGCGTGRLLLPLARAGYRITGVDLSPAMLEQARRKLTAEGLQGNATLLEQDMRRLCVDERFVMVFVALNSFMHLLTLEDQLACLEGVRKHLAPGGLFLLDLFNPDLGRLLDSCGQVTLEKVMINPRTGCQVTKFHSVQADLGQQVLRVTYILDEIGKDGFLRRTLFPFSMRYLFRGELELLLRYAGFELEAIYGSYDLDEYSGDSERMIAVSKLAD